MPMMETIAVPSAPQTCDSKRHLVHTRLEEQNALIQKHLPHMQY